MRRTAISSPTSTKATARRGGSQHLGSATVYEVLSRVHFFSFRKRALLVSGLLIVVVLLSGTHVVPLSWEPLDDVPLRRGTSNCEPLSQPKLVPFESKTVKGSGFRLSVIPPQKWASHADDAKLGNVFGNWSATVFHYDTSPATHRALLSVTQFCQPSNSFLGSLINRVFGEAPPSKGAHPEGNQTWWEVLCGRGGGAKHEDREPLMQPAWASLYVASQHGQPPLVGATITLADFPALSPPPSLPNSSVEAGALVVMPVGGTFKHRWEGGKVTASLAPTVLTNLLHLAASQVARAARGAHTTPITISIAAFLDDNNSNHPHSENPHTWFGEPDSLALSERWNRCSQRWLESWSQQPRGTPTAAPQPQKRNISLTFAEPSISHQLPVRGSNGANWCDERLSVHKLALTATYADIVVVLPITLTLLSFACSGAAPSAASPALADSLATLVHLGLNLATTRPSTRFLGMIVIKETTVLHKLTGGHSKFGFDASSATNDDYLVHCALQSLGAGSRCEPKSATSPGTHVDPRSVLYEDEDPVEQLLKPLLPTNDGKGEALAAQPIIHVPSGKWLAEIVRRAYNGSSTDTFSLARSVTTEASLHLPLHAMSVRHHGADFELSQVRLVGYTPDVVQLTLTSREDESTTTAAPTTTTTTPVVPDPRSLTTPLPTSPPLPLWKHYNIAIETSVGSLIKSIFRPGTELEGVMPVLRHNGRVSRSRPALGLPERRKEIKSNSGATTEFGDRAAAVDVLSVDMFAIKLWAFSAANGLFSRGPIGKWVPLRGDVARAFLMRAPLITVENVEQSSLHLVAENHLIRRATRTVVDYLGTMAASDLHHDETHVVTLEALQPHTHLRGDDSLGLLLSTKLRLVRSQPNGRALAPPFNRIQSTWARGVALPQVGIQTESNDGPNLVSLGSSRGLEVAAAEWDVHLSSASPLSTPFWVEMPSRDEIPALHHCVSPIFYTRQSQVLKPGWHLLRAIVGLEVRGDASLLVDAVAAGFVSFLKQQLQCGGMGEWAAQAFLVEGWFADSSDLQATNRTFNAADQFASLTASWYGYESPSAQRRHRVKRPDVNGTYPIWLTGTSSPLGSTVYQSAISLSHPKRQWERAHFSIRGDSIDLDSDVGGVYLSMTNAKLKATVRALLNSPISNSIRPACRRGKALHGNVTLGVFLTEKMVAISEKCLQGQAGSTCYPGGSHNTSHVLRCAVSRINRIEERLSASPVLLSKSLPYPHHQWQQWLIRWVGRLAVGGGDKHSYLNAWPSCSDLPVAPTTLYRPLIVAESAWDTLSKGVGPVEVVNLTTVVGFGPAVSRTAATTSQLVDSEKPSGLWVANAVAQQRRRVQDNVERAFADHMELATHATLMKMSPMNETTVHLAVAYIHALMGDVNNRNVGPIESTRRLRVPVAIVSAFLALPSRKAHSLTIHQEALGALLRILDSLRGRRWDLGDSPDSAVFALREADWGCIRMWLSKRSPDAMRCASLEGLGPDHALQVAVSHVRERVEALVDTTHTVRHIVQAFTTSEAISTAQLLSRAASLFAHMGKFHLHAERVPVHCSGISTEISNEMGAYLNHKLSLPLRQSAIPATDLCDPPPNHASRIERSFASYNPIRFQLSRHEHWFPPVSVVGISLSSEVIDNVSAMLRDSGSSLRDHLGDQLRAYVSVMGTQRVLLPSGLQHPATDATIWALASGKDVRLSTMHSPPNYATGGRAALASYLNSGSKTKSNKKTIASVKVRSVGHDLGMELSTFERLVVDMHFKERNQGTRIELPVVLKFNEEETIGFATPLIGDLPVPLPNGKFKRPKAEQVFICRAMHEASTVPRSWAQSAGKCDQIWVPSSFTRQTFLNAFAHVEYEVTLANSSDGPPSDHFLQWSPTFVEGDTLGACIIHYQNWTGLDDDTRKTSPDIAKLLQRVVTGSIKGFIHGRLSHDAMALPKRESWSLPTHRCGELVCLGSNKSFVRITPRIVSSYPLERIVVMPEVLDTSEGADPAFGVKDASAVISRTYPTSWKESQASSTSWCSRRCYTESGDALLGNNRTARFHSNFKWEPRKGWPVMVRAFVSAFMNTTTAANNLLEPILYIQTKIFFPAMTDADRKAPGGKVAFLRRQIDEELDDIVHNATSHTNFPCVCISTTGLHKSQINDLYEAADVFVLATRGEGWGLPLAEAMVLGKRILSTQWGGATEFLEMGSYPLTNAIINREDDGVRMIEVASVDEVNVSKFPRIFIEPGMRYATPSWIHLSRLFVDSQTQIVKERCGGEGHSTATAGICSPVAGMLVANRGRIVDHYSEEAMGTMLASTIAATANLYL